MPEAAAKKITVRALVASGVLMVVAGTALALAVDPLLGLITLVGAIDLVLAWAFATDRLGTPGAAVAEDGTPIDPAQDPSYNPYARED